MRCPRCGADDVKVVDSRKAPTVIQRRRKCQECDYRWSTLERVMTDGADGQLRAGLSALVFRCGAETARGVVEDILGELEARVCGLGGEDIARRERRGQ